MTSPRRIQLQRTKTAKKMEEKLILVDPHLLLLCCSSSSPPPKVSADMLLLFFTMASCTYINTSSNGQQPNANSKFGVKSRHFIYLICHEITREHTTPDHETACRQCHIFVKLHELKLKLYASVTS